MEIKKELKDAQKEWNALKSYGDGIQIADDSGIHVTQISRAYTAKALSPEIYEAMNKFYAKRKKQISKSTDSIK